MTRRRSIRRPARDRRSWRAGAGRRVPLRSGWNWTPSSRPAGDRRDERRAVRRSWRGSGRRPTPSGGCAGVRVDEVEVGAVGDAVEQRVRARPLDLVPADVREGRRVRAGGRVRPGHDAEGRRRRPRRCRRTGAADRGRCRGTADRPRATPGSARSGRRASRRAIAGSAAPTPGHDERVGIARDRLASRDERRPRRRRPSAPARC